MTTTTSDAPMDVCARMEVAREIVVISEDEDASPTPASVVVDSLTLVRARRERDETRCKLWRAVRAAGRARQRGVVARGRSPERDF